MSRLKPKLKHKNSGKSKGVKDTQYLSYMHNSYKTCVVCSSPTIELHHIKAYDIVGRDDRYVLPLCVEHHRGTFSPHGAEKKAFFDKFSIDEQKAKAEKFYREFLNLFTPKSEEVSRLSNPFMENF